MKLKNFIIAAVASFSAVMLMGASSCESVMDPSKPSDVADTTPKTVISVHDIVKYRRAELNEIEVTSYFGDPICVNKNPGLHSKYITKVEAVPRKEDPGFYNLVLTLNDGGLKRWIGLSVLNKGKEVAFLVDGVYYRSFKPMMLDDDKKVSVIIQGPFDEYTTKSICNNAERNYKLFNNN